MEFGDVRAFVAVARGGSLAVAAAQLHLTASAVSKSLRRLEQSLRTPLFDRDGARLQLNDAGQRFLRRAQALIDLAEQARSELAQRDTVQHARIAGPALLQWQHAHALLHAFRARHPCGQLAFDSAYEAEALAALEAGRVDAALVSAQALTDTQAAGLRTRVLGALQTVLAVAPAHPLARAPAPDARALHAHAWACTRTSALCGQPRALQSEAWAESVGLPAPALRVDDLTVLLRLVRAGATAAFLPRFLVDEHALVPVDLPPGLAPADETVLLVRRPGSADWADALP